MEKRRRKTLKIVLIAVAAVAVLAIITGSIYAALKDTTAVVNNTLDPARVTCDVLEVFNGTNKANVRVKNTGNIPALLRAKVVINWVDNDGNVVYNPGSDYRYTVTLANPLNWTNDSGSSTVTDGYWYYNGIVQPDAETTALIATAVESLGASVSANPQYRLNITIMAEAIQAAPNTASSTEWRMVYSDGAWYPAS